MKKLFVFFFAVVLVLFSAVSFSAHYYDMEDAKTDADIVLQHFSGSDSSASAAFSRLYDYFYHDAADYVLNSSKGKFHKPTCKGVEQMNKSNKVSITCSREFLLSLGYDPCGNCKP